MWSQRFLSAVFIRCFQHGGRSYSFGIDMKLFEDLLVLQSAGMHKGYYRMPPDVPVRERQLRQLKYVVFSSEF